MSVRSWRDERAEKDPWLLMAIKGLARIVGVKTLVQLLLLLVLLLYVAYGLGEASSRLDPRRLTQPLLLGALLGWWLARSRWRAWAAWILLILSGAVTVTIVAGGLEGTVRALTWQAAQAVFNPYLGWTRTAILARVPFIEASEALWLSLQLLAGRATTWVTAILQQEAAYSPSMTALVWSLALWLVGAWASWGIRRWQQPLAGVLPAGTILGAALAYTGAPAVWLLGILVPTLLLMAWGRFYQRLESWEQNHIDYAEDLRLDVSLVAIGLTIGLATAGGLASTVTLENIERIIDHFRPKLIESEVQVARPLGLETLATQTAARKALTGIDTAGLPRQHLIGSGAELSQLAVMTVATGDIPPIPVQSFQVVSAPTYYWRALTYDIYTGRGWITSPTQSISYAAREPAQRGLALFPLEGQLISLEPLSDLPGVRLLRQQVTPMANLNGLVYASGDLLGVNQYYAADWRIPPDPFTSTYDDLFAATGIYEDYSAWSMLSRPTESQLLAANTPDYPSWVSERYLALPQELAPRLKELAERLTSDQATIYERALAIEAYLRDYPYTLDLPQPPADREIVDYFLFDLKRGYCDYNASAMVVLARLAGIPARLAVGYAGGDYDPYQAYYRVTEAEAHSWPELFFAGIGWVEFEPTGSYPTIERTPEIDPERTDISQPLPEAVEPELDSRLWLRRLLVVLGAGLALGLAKLIFDAWRLRRLSPNQLAVHLFARLHRQGARLGSPARVGDTPLEYSQRLGQLLQQQPRGKSLQRLLQQAPELLSSLAALYNRAMFGRAALTRSDRREAFHLWRQISRGLARLRWERRLGRFRRKR